jgi:hypothetical protein
VNELEWANVQTIAMLGRQHEVSGTSQAWPGRWALRALRLRRDAEGGRVGGKPGPEAHDAIEK